jgi:hypothetical protein
MSSEDVSELQQHTQEERPDDGTHNLPILVVDNKLPASECGEPVISAINEPSLSWAAK